MKFNYFPDVDALYIELREGSGADSDEIADGFVVDLDVDGRVIGLDISNASQRLDLKALEITGLSLPVMIGDKEAKLH